MTAADPAFRRNSWIIVALGFAQGLALYGANKFTNGQDAWGQSHPWLSLVLWGWALFLPPTAQWLIQHHQRRGYWAMLGLVAVAVPLICWEPARTAVPQARALEQPLILGGILIWAAAISLASTAMSSGLRDYPNLFRLTCRTVLLPAGALLFTLIFMGLLHLCGALFELIHIDFVKRLLELGWLIVPVYGTVFGVATAILIDRPTLVDGVRRACTAIAAALLPVIVAIHLLFLIGLLFAGLEPLWATRHATPLVLVLLVGFLILLNGTHEEGTKLDCLARPIAGVTRIAILLSPIYVAIAAYSLALRIGQYGWSPDRVISACLVAFVGTVVLTYFVAAIRRPFFVIPRLATSNMIALTGLIVLSAAANSPVLSPQRIAASSQEARILAGRVAPQNVDWANLAFDLGRYGRDAIIRIGSLKDGPGQEELRIKAAEALDAKDRYVLSRDNRRLAADNYRVVPGDTPPPDGLIEAIRGELRWSVPPRCEVGCRLLSVDLNEDGEAELILLAGSLPVFGHLEGRWTRIGEMAELGKSIDRPAMIENLGKGRAQTVPSDWKDLEIEGVRLQFRPTR